MTNGTGLFQQTIYYPYRWALQFARGTVLNVLVQSPTYEVSHLDPVPYLDAAATLNAENGQTSIFILNRDLSKAREVEIVWQDNPGKQVLASRVLTGNDLKAVNSFAAPQRVQPQTLDKPSMNGGRTTFEVPARSYTVLQWAS
jgi:alpha-N-arabinofuranosidase